MTADAKIGLLLGLMFIVIIAFLLNGLPDFLQQDSEGVIQTAITPASYNQAVVEQTVSRIVSDMEPAPLREVAPPQETQVVTDFSQGQPLVQPMLQPVAPPAAVEESPSAQTIELPAIPQPYTPAPAVNYAAMTQPARQVHIVQKGESLAAIASKYYGSEIGNKHDTVQRLFEANRSVLESPDKIRVGDQLAIPPAGEMGSVSAGSNRSTTQTLLNQFSNVFEPVSGSKAATTVTRPAARAKEYTVKDGDRLWDIAEQFLGEGRRYNEIVRLNQLGDPDHIPAGTKLKIPSR